MRAGVCAIAFSTVALLVGCAHRPVNHQADIDRLSSSIEALRVQNASYARQVEELENRIYILNDQLESRKINEERAETPRLPTVALHPTSSPAPSPLSQLPEGTQMLSGPEVEYAGEAAKETTHRPVLRLHGEAGSITVIREPTPSGIHVVREGGPRLSREDHPEAVALYRKAFAALRAGEHEEAERGFKEFLRKYPNHDLADNSQYWLGECYYDRKDYAQAVREFRRVIERYPNGNKVPDALLKVGFSYLALGSLEAGRQTLSQLQRSYPRHEAAGLAAARLAAMDHSTPVRSAAESAHPATSSTKPAPASEEAP